MPRYLLALIRPMIPAGRFILAFILTSGLGNAIFRMMRSQEKQAIPAPDKTLPIVPVYQPPQDIGPCMARFVYNDFKYDGKVLKVLLTCAVAKGLVKLCYSTHEDAYILEALVPSEHFETLTETEREALFILLGSRFNAGRIFSFSGYKYSNVESIEKAHAFLQERLESESRIFRHAYARVMGFKKYMEIGESTRLPGSTPETAKVTFVSHALEYFPYAMAYDLENQWNKYLSADISYAYDAFINQKYSDAIWNSYARAVMRDTYPGN